MRSPKTAVAIVVALLALTALAQDRAGEADAKKVAAKLVEIAKAKGLAGVVDAVNNTDVCLANKDKGLACGVYDGDFKVLANPLRPALVGQTMKDLLDPDGKNISLGMVGPVKGEPKQLSWEFDFKFNQPGSKVIGLRRAYCARLDANSAACVAVVKG